MIIKFQHKKKKTGLNLLEMVIALVITVIAFIPLVGVFSGFNKATTSQKDIETAQKLALEKIEEYKTLPFAEIAKRAGSGKVEKGSVVTQKSAAGFGYKHEMYTRFKRDVTLKLLNPSFISNKAKQRNVIKIEVFVYWHNKLMRDADERYLQMSTFISKKEF
ncbi:hypothetical protein ACFL35_15260 [Candidatus Riflebacteria bacterium]